MTFLYKVKDESGATLYGITEAKDIAEVKKQLRTSEYFFVSCDPYDVRDFAKIHLKSDDLLMFTRRFSYLIDAGIPILQGLNILWRQSDQKDLQIVVSYMRKKLEDGASLQEIFNVFPGVFPPIYLALVGVAEIGAGLAKILIKISEYLEYQKQFVSKIKRATMYPLFVLGLACLVVVGMFVFVVPVFQKAILKLHGQLPLLTKFLFGISSLMTNPFFLLGFACLVVAGIYLWKYVATAQKLKYRLDYLKLKLPLLKKMLYPLLMGRLARSLGLLVGNGIPLLQGLEAAKVTVGNTYVEASVDEVKRQITEGGTLHEAFKSTKAFPVLMTEMVGVGESSGKLQQMLETIAVHMEEEADYAMTKFLTYLEPALIIFVGGIVLCVLLGIYLPIFSLQHVLRTM